MPAAPRPQAAPVAPASQPGKANSPAELAGMFAANLDENATASAHASGVEAQPAGMFVAETEDVTPEEAAPPPGIPAGEVLSIAVESLDNLAHAVEPNLAMTPRERQTMVKAAALMPAAHTLPWWMGATIAGAGWMLRVWMWWTMRKAKAAAQAPAVAPPPSPAPAAPEQPDNLAAILGGAQS